MLCRLVLVCALLAAISGCGAKDRRSAPPGPRGAPLGPATVRPPIRVGGTPVGVVVSDGAVWVANQTGGTVVPVDPVRRMAGRPIAVGNAPFAIAAGEGAVWVAGGDGVVRSIDPRTRRMDGRSVRLEDANGLAAGAGGVWVTNRVAGTVTRIDPRTRKADPPIPVGAGPADVAVAGGDVWVANAQEGSVSRIDPRTRRAGKPIKTGGGSVLALAAGEGGVWVARASGPFSDRVDVIRLDPETGRPSGRPVRVSGATPLDLAAGGGSLWATDVGGVRPPGPVVPGTVTRIDPRGPAAVRPPLRVGDGPSGVAVGAGGAWVVNASDGTLTPINVASR